MASDLGDEETMARILGEGRVLVTLDKDFGESAIIHSINQRRAIAVRDRRRVRYSRAFATSRTGPRRVICCGKRTQTSSSHVWIQGATCGRPRLFADSASPASHNTLKSLIAERAAATFHAREAALVGLFTIRRSRCPRQLW